MVATPIRSPRSNTYLLPLEKAAVIVKGEKYTTDIAKEVRFCLGEMKPANSIQTDKRKLEEDWDGRNTDSIK